MTQFSSGKWDGVRVLTYRDLGCRGSGSSPAGSRVFQISKSVTVKNEKRENSLAARSFRVPVMKSSSASESAAALVEVDPFSVFNNEGSRGYV